MSSDDLCHYQIQSLDELTYLEAEELHDLHGNIVDETSGEENSSCQRSMERSLLNMTRKGRIRNKEENRCEIYSQGRYVEMTLGGSVERPGCKFSVSCNSCNVYSFHTITKSIECLA